MKKLSFVNGTCQFACVAAVLIMNTSLYSAETKPPDEVVIDSKLWKVQKYGDVKFTHKKHVEDRKIGCTECHHVYKDGKNVWKQGDKVQRCDACHTCVKTGKALKDATPEEKKRSLFAAFRDNCKRCHKKHNKETNTKAAPTRCTACHPKRPK